MQNWWENFFHGIALDFWRAAISEEQTRIEAQFIQKQLQLSADANVLDAPCGNGRLSVELTQRGLRMTGIDIAAEFITEARAKSTDRKLEIEWHERDMRELPWPQRFDGAFCFGNSFSYFDDEGNAEFLKAVSGSLKPGARFIIDTHAVAESILPNFQEHRSFELGDITLVVDHRYDYEQGRLHTDYTFIRDGQEDKRPGSQRIYPYRELVELLHTANLKTVAAYGSLDEGPFQPGQRLLLVCQKNR